MGILVTDSTAVKAFANAYFYFATNTYQLPKSLHLAANECMLQQAWIKNTTP